MGNMSYCRFENTSRDLQDCIEAIQDHYEQCTDLSRYELRALSDLLEQAEEIGLYSPVDYNKYPESYCGEMITSTPYDFKNN